MFPEYYNHPVIKRSASSLSKKSLEICTECLGSETGSDGFSFYAPSETGDAYKEEVEEQEDRAIVKYDLKDWRVAKYSLLSKKSSPKAFPLPLPSLSRPDGASLRMRPRRDKGILVLEAVFIRSQSNFRAQRQEGRCGSKDQR